MKRLLVAGLLAGLMVGAVSVAPAGAEDSVITIDVDDSGAITLTNDPDRGTTLLDTPPARTPLIPNEDELKEYVQRAAQEHDLSEGLIFAVIRAESFGDHEARSEAGAMGLMQLMPSTAEQMGVEDPTDPEQNILGGSRYLARMIQRFDGQLDLALAAYNAGPTRVERVGRVPEIDETLEYVDRVREGFDRFEVRDRVVYTYRDEDGQLHVTNLRPRER